jgi:hypothetical protein
MIRLAEVKGVTRSDDGVDVKCVMSDGEVVTAEHFAPPGDDSIPVAGDTVAIAETEGAGKYRVVAYDDPNNASKAENGERRTYARSADGEVVAEIWAKSDGSITVTSLKDGAGIELATTATGVINLNGVEIDALGNISTPGGIDATLDVTAVNGTASLGTHTHLFPATGGAPTSVPVPTPPTP